MDSFINTMFTVTFYVFASGIGFENAGY